MDRTVHVFWKTGHIRNVRSVYFWKKVPIRFIRYIWAALSIWELYMTSPIWTVYEQKNLYMDRTVHIEKHLAV